MSTRVAVLGLYRRLMRLHQRLPDSDMAELGRQFAREEFRQHKSADAKFAASFVEEWTHYAEVLEGQLRNSETKEEEEEDEGEERDKNGFLGQSISSSALNMMTEQQLGQLLELKNETTKPRIDDRTD